MNGEVYKKFNVIPHEGVTGHVSRLLIVLTKFFPLDP
jgi:hypothetical protein